MPQAAVVAENHLTQLVSQCRDQPVVIDGIRPELCESLKQVIERRMQSDRGRRVGSLNVGGWKSSEDFFTWAEASVQELRHSIGALVGTTKALVGWAMVNRAGSQHPRHQHRLARLVGVYYVTSGNQEALAPTIFECPCDGGAKPSERYELAVDPHPGRLALFRGETWHRVPAYGGDLPRITIAFDVRR